MNPEFWSRHSVASYLVTTGALITLYLAHVPLTLFYIALTGILVTALHLMRPQKTRWAATGILAGLVTMVVGYLFLGSLSRFQNVIEWDFLAIYLYGKAGAGGLPIYEPESYQGILQSLNLPFEVSSGFHENVIDVGYPYPPTTMLMMSPLGLLDIELANIAWRIFISIFLILDVILIRKFFALDCKMPIRVLIAIGLTLSIPGSNTTIMMGQTHFLLLFFLLLIYNDLDDWKSGVYLALSVTVKPLAAIWGLYYLVHKKWKPGLSFVVTGSVLAMASILVFGLDNFMAYFVSSPASRIPHEAFIEPINQSLNAVFLRSLIGLGVDPIQTAAKYAPTAISLILALLSCVGSRRIYRKDKKAAFLIFLPLAILIYPGSLMHYAVQLLPFLLALYSTRNRKNNWYLGAIILMLPLSCFGASAMALAILMFFSFQGRPLLADNYHE